MFAEEVKEENKHTLDMDIHWIGYLHKLKEGELKATLIIEFRNEAQADRAIRTGICIGNEWYRCEVYNRQARSMQCFKCWLYGYVSTSCHNTERCGACAGEHNHRSCPRGLASKCVACGSNHTAWSKECPAKKKDIERMKAAKANTPHYHGTTQLYGQSGGPTAVGTASEPSEQTIHGKRRSEPDSEGFVTPARFDRPSSDRAGPSIQGRGRGGSSLSTRGGITSSRTPLIPAAVSVMSTRSSSPEKRRSRSPAKVPSELGVSTRSRIREPLIQIPANIPALPPSSAASGYGSRRLKKGSNAIRDQEVEEEVIDFEASQENNDGGDE